MIQEEIGTSLVKQGYQKMKTNKEELCLYIKEEQGIAYCVCLLDDQRHILVHPFLLEHLMEQTRNLFLEKGKECRLLGVAITDDVSRTKGMLDGHEAKWLIDAVDRKLVIFENQPADFLNLRANIEDICADHGSFETGSAFSDHLTKESRGKSAEKRKENKLTGKKILKMIHSPANMSIILINVLIFIGMEWVGDTNDTMFMYQYGAISIDEFLGNPEYWRLLSSAFLHFGFFHLLGNMVVLWYLGNVLERIVGSGRYTAIYLISAVGANLISIWWHVQSGELNVVSAGASGAIFGVVGALFYIVIKNRGHVRDISGRQLFLLSLFTLFHGFSSININNSAHIGGLIMGALCGMLFYSNKKQKAA